MHKRQIIKKILKESDFDWVGDVDAVEDFEPRIGDRFIWDDYSYGGDEIVVLDKKYYDKSLFIVFDSVDNLEKIDREKKLGKHYDEPDEVDIKTFKVGLRKGWLVPLELKHLKESEGWEWMDEIETPVINRLVDIIEEAMDRLPNPREDIEGYIDEFGYGWIKKLETQAGFLYKEAKRKKENYNGLSVMVLASHVVSYLNWFYSALSGRTDYKGYIFRDYDGQYGDFLNVYDVISKHGIDN